MQGLSCCLCRIYAECMQPVSTVYAVHAQIIYRIHADCAKYADSTQILCTCMQFYTNICDAYAINMQIMWTLCKVYADCTWYIYIYIYINADYVKYLCKIFHDADWLQNICRLFMFMITVYAYAVLIQVICRLNADYADYMQSIYNLYSFFRRLREIYMWIICGLNLCADYMCIKMCDMCKTCRSSWHDISLQCQHWQDADPLDNVRGVGISQVYPWDNFSEKNILEISHRYPKF